MDAKKEELAMAIYKSSKFTGGCLEIRLFYVRFAPCQVDCLPDHITLCYLHREIGVSLEINGCRFPASEVASITLRRDRVDRDFSEVTYVTTDNIRLTGAVEFEVRENEEKLILCGSLDRLETTAWTNGSVLENDLKTGWSMDCYSAASITCGGSHFFQPKHGVYSPTIEVYIAGCCSRTPLILTKTIQVNPRNKMNRHSMYAIPEDDEMEKEQGPANESLRQRNLQITEANMEDSESDGKMGNHCYPEDMDPGEDGELTWFSAGVRVGVGIGLGMCIGVGIGVGVLMRSYQAATRRFRRRFF